MATVERENIGLLNDKLTVKIKKEDYLNLIYEGNDLSLAERIKMDQIAVTPATYGGQEYREFKLTKNYLLVKQGKTQRFKPSKKGFIKEFPSIEPALKNYFKENTVDFNDHGDLNQVMIFIDEALVNK